MSDPGGDDARVAKNCVTFVSLLFSFGMLSGGTMFDLMRFLFQSGKVSEVRVELALTLLRYCGRRLRSDCAEHFKEALLHVTSVATAVEGDVGGLRTRLDFLLRELQDLKNNKVCFVV